MLPTLVTVTVLALCPPAPLPPTATDAAPTPAVNDPAAENPPLPPPPPIACARMPFGLSPSVRMLPLLSTTTAPAVSANALAAHPALLFPPAGVFPAPGRRPPACLVFAAAGLRPRPAAPPAGAAPAPKPRPRAPPGREGAARGEAAVAAAAADCL